MSDRQSKPEGYFLLMQQEQQTSVRVDFAAMWLSIKRGYLVIIGVTSLCLALAITHAYFLATPIYSSTALIAVRTPEAGAGTGAGSQLAGLASLAGVQINSGSSKREEYIAILSSRTIVKKLIEQDDLIPVLFSGKYDAQTKKWEGKPPTTGMALDYFTRSVRSISEDKKTGLISLTINWRDPKIAAQWANQLVTIANQAVRNTTIQQASQNEQYLKREMQGATFETLRESILRLTEANMNQAMLAQIQNDYAYTVIDAPEVSEDDKFVKPQRALELAVSIILGLFAGIALQVLRDWRKIIRRTASQPSEMQTN